MLFKILLELLEHHNDDLTECYWLISTSLRDATYTSGSPIFADADRDSLLTLPITWINDQTRSISLVDPARPPYPWIKSKVLEISQP